MASRGESQKPKRRGLCDYTKQGIGPRHVGIFYRKRPPRKWICLKGVYRIDHFPISGPTQALTFDKDHAQEKAIGVLAHFSARGGRLDFAIKWNYQEAGGFISSIRGRACDAPLLNYRVSSRKI